MSVTGISLKNSAASSGDSCMVILLLGELSYSPENKRTNKKNSRIRANSRNLYGAVSKYSRLRKPSLKKSIISGLYGQRTHPAGVWFLYHL
jgi:hypothetical protein